MKTRYDFWSPPDLLSEVYELKRMLGEAVEVIERVADQQAMEDDWYKDDLDRFRKKAEK